MEADQAKSQLADFARRMNDLCEEIVRTDRMNLDRARECGELQNDAQKLLKSIKPKKTLATWLKENLPNRQPSTLALYKRIATNWEIVAEARKSNPDITIPRARDRIKRELDMANEVDRSSDQEYIVANGRRIWNDPTLTEDQKTWHIELIHKLDDFLRANTKRKYRRTGCVDSSFLDSGAFSLGNMKLTPAKNEEYRDQYGEFVTRRGNKLAIDFFANLDVIGDPELTWQNQLYLESVHRCQPMPVVHFGTDDDLKWLTKYIDKGHAYIGLGGLVKANPTKRHTWVAKCFELANKRNTSEKTIKFHGFGVGTQPLMAAFPWHSVDSSSWSQAGGSGRIFVPPFEDGEFKFDKPPRTIQVSEMVEPDNVTAGEREADDTTIASELSTLDQETYRQMRLWLKTIRIPFSARYESDDEKHGVKHRHDHEPRRIANMLYMQRVADHYGIRMYFSGDGTRNCNPEGIFGDKANVMLTFFKLIESKRSDGSPPARFRRLVRARRRGQNKNAEPG